MDKWIVIANGPISLRKINLPKDYDIIAVDGGARYCLKHRIKPKVVIGDFDSLSNKEIITLQNQQIELVRYPEDKDQTDLELALDYVQDLGAKEIIIYGILGGRWDMTFANILLLASPAYAGIKFQIIDDSITGYIVRGGETLNIFGEPDDTISIIPLHGSAVGVTYKGLLWPLEKELLPVGSPRGVSNIFVGNAAQISLQKGTLLIFIQDPLESTT